MNSVRLLLQEYPIFSISECAVEKKTSYQQDGISFKGSARRDPNRKECFLLILDPLEKNGAPRIIEFKNSDLLFVQQEETVVHKDGHSISIFTFWIKKGASGIEMIPFKVSE